MTSRPTVVFVTSGLAGVRIPNLELARRLVEAGMRVTYASPDDIREDVESRGLAFLGLEAPGRSGGPADRDAAAPSRSIGNRVLRAFRPGARRHAEVATWGTDAAVERLRALDPDLVLIDLELNRYTIAAVGAGLPVALVSTWLAMWKRPGIAPLHRYVPPRPGWRGRLVADWAWRRYWIWKTGRRWLERLRRAGVDQASTLRTLARQVGFAFGREVDFRQWPIPFGYRRLPLVLLNARELDLPHEPPPHVRYAGPMVPPPVEDEPAEGEWARAEPDRPLLYVAFGSFFQGDDAPFIRRVMTAVADRPDLDVVIAVGNRMNPASLGPLPAHARAFGWVPQARVLRHASAAVIHGGIATINECVAAGVPMVVYPFDTNDQMGTTARVTHHGLGIVGDRERDGAEVIRTHIERVLTEPTYRTRIEAMQARFDAYDRDGIAIGVVRELLERARSGVSPAT